MKTRYILSILAAFSLFAVGCEEALPGDLDEFQVDKSYVSIPEAGGEGSIKVSSTGSWQVYSDANNVIPEWLTINPMSGGSGNATVSFSAGSTPNYREATIKIKIGDKYQHITVAQGVNMISEATCAEVLSGPDGKTYRASGIVTNISNTTYGNWYLKDDTGEVYIYGTLDANGAEKNFTSLGIEEGDEVTVEGPKTTYNGTTVELVNVKVISITKSLIQLTGISEGEISKEGGNAFVKLVSKGGNIAVEIPDADKEWLSISNIEVVPGVPDPTFPTIAVPDTTVIIFKAQPNNMGARKTTVSFSSSANGNTSTITADINQAGAIAEVTVAEFKEKPVGDALYRITGKVRGIVNSKYGNIYIEDGTGYVYVYTLFENSDKVAQSFANLGLREGDIITIVGPRDEYPGAKVEDQKIQMKNAYCETVIKSTDATVADILAAPIASKYLESKYYRVTGVIKSIVNDQYGNIYLKEKDTDTYIYVYGITNAPVAKNNKSFQSLGLVEGDEITIVGQRGQYASSKVEDQKEQMANSYFISKVESE